MTNLQHFLSGCAITIESGLSQLLPETLAPNKRLMTAIRYSALDGGKRLRPALLIATAEALNAPREVTIQPACAVEMIHVYSLIHDDLPAMDDDDLRRGKPSCHKAYDEATAILAGDALQAQAFYALSTAPDLSPDIRLKMIETLSEASGSAGMVAGQAIDLDSVGKPLSLEQLETMHLYKTGALIEASIVMGALCAGMQDTTNLSLLRSFARSIGLAFQVKDDILDVESDTETLGKPQGADEALNKPTYVSLLGLEGAKHKCHQLRELAMSELQLLSGADITRLEQLCAFIVDRKH